MQRLFCLLFLAGCSGPIDIIDIEALGTSGGTFLEAHPKARLLEADLLESKSEDRRRYRELVESKYFSRVLWVIHEDDGVLAGFVRLKSNAMKNEVLDAMTLRFGPPREWCDETNETCAITKKPRFNWYEPTALIALSKSGLDWEICFEQRSASAE